jgi:type IV pilus assembly protein PilE
MKKGMDMRRAESGFSLIELMVALIVVGVLASIAIPSYQSYLVRAAREEARTELLHLASLQEKIYLNSNAYTSSLSAAYDGNSGGGLGSDGQTANHKYTIQLVSDGQAFTLTATPVVDGPQADDGDISISSNGQRLWNGTSW